MENFYYCSALAFFPSLILISGIIQADVSYDGPTSVLETHQFSLSCNSSQFGYIKWRKSDPILYFESDNSTFLIDERKFSNITITSALSLHTGNYKCSYEVHDYGYNVTVVVAIKLSVIHSGVSCPNESELVANPLKGGANVPAENNEACVVAEPYAENLTLQCVSDSLLPANVTLSWFKDTSSTPIQTSDRERIKVFGLNPSVLNFTSILPNDAGLYQCRPVKKNFDAKYITSDKPATVDVRVLPYVKHPMKDVTAIEEKHLNLTCVVLSTVPTNVKWLVSTLEGKFEREYTESDGRVILSKINSSSNAVFYINSTKMSVDRKKYVCIAESAVGRSPTNTTFTVRIKSKYAALWPFLGICAEVFMLCTIILIYEKKRDKSELEESDTDQGPEIKSSPDHGHDGVRYRK